MSDYAWLSELKAGDPVCRVHGTYDNRYYDFTTVEKVTKTQIKIVGREIRYRVKNGREMADRGPWSNAVDELEPDNNSTRKRVAG